MFETFNPLELSVFKLLENREMSAHQDPYFMTNGQQTVPDSPTNTQDLSVVCSHRVSFETLSLDESIKLSCDESIRSVRAHASETDLTPPLNVYHTSKVYENKQQLRAAVCEFLAQKQTWEHYACQAPTIDKTDQIKSIVEKMSASRGISLPTDSLYQLEGLIALFFALTRAVDPVQAIAIITLYLQRFYSKSVVELVIDVITDQTIENQAVEKPNWLTLLKQASTNWQLVIANEGFSHMSNVLSIMLGLGLCDSSNIDFTVHGMKLFNVQAQRKQVSAISLVDAIFTTVNYFVEGGYECYRQGSFKPLLYGDLDMQDLEKQMALCEQYTEFAKTGDLEKRANITNNDFDSMLRNVIDKIEIMVKTTNNPMALKMLRDKLDRMRKHQTYFMQTRVQGGLREAPWAAGVYGSTGVGKSSIANILMICVLMHNGYNASDDVLITLNDGDKFMSNYRSNTNGIFIDDEGNTKIEFVDKAPSARKIELVNNVRAYATMAEAELKGKVSLEPKVVLSTKNPKDGGCTATSNEPASIVRREQVLVTAKVRERFSTNKMLDVEKARLFYNGVIPLIPDLWELTVERAFPISNPTKGRPDLIGWEILSHEGKRMVDVSIFDVVRYSCETSAVYFSNQKKLVENSNNLAQKLDFCGACSYPACMCHCEIPQKSVSVDNQAGALLAPFAWSQFVSYRKKYTSKFHKFMDVFESTSITEATKRISWLESSRWMVWTNFVPTHYLDNQYFYQAMLMHNGPQLKRQLLTLYAGCFLAVCFLLNLAVFTHWAFLFLLAVPIHRAAAGVELEKARLYAQVKKDNNAMPEIFKKYRDGFIEYITGACVVISFIYLLSQTWELIKVIPEAQGNLAPTSVEEIHERDKEATLINEVAIERNWTKVPISPIPCSGVARTCTSEQLKGMVMKNLAMFTFEHEGKKHGCDIFFVESNIAVVPQHIWTSDELIAQISKTDTEKLGTNFEARLSRTHSVDIIDTDMSLVYVPNGGSWKNLSNYLPTAQFRSVPGKFMYKHLNPLGEMKTLECATYLDTGITGNAAKQFWGAKYKLDFNTFVGLCMAPIVTDTKQAVIAGFHLGGVRGTPNGTCGTLFKSRFDEARDTLSRIPGLVLAASEGTLVTNMYDTQFFTGTTIHQKSPVHKLPDDAHVELYGTCTGRATYHSDVEPTSICSLVEEVCEVTNEYGPPKFYMGDAWHKSLGVSSKPSIGVEGNLLAKAVVDYTVPIIQKVENLKGFATVKQYVRPLTEMETVCGIDGVRFIDKMDVSTSIGFPLSGAKSKHITMLDPELFPNQECPAVLDPKFWDEFYRMEDEYREGRRCHIVFKACLKDEPTKLTKDKIRVFQAAPIALQLGMRKYYLPIARLLSLMPLDSECAVGINTNGPEWDQLAQHMRKHGTDRILAGDYSKYDLRMPAQLTMAAFDVLMRIAKHFGYSDDALTIMRGIATDVCYPLMAFNGDLLQLFGSNPSGQNLTVYINSIVNSLLLRCAFFKIFENRKVPHFREIVAASTYGDDVKGSVKCGYDEFNHISFADFLKHRDIIFTMPDKESTPTQYMLDTDADFLKKKNIWSEELQLWMGALDESSILKSLMSGTVSSAITKNEQSMQNIDGALREWFYHGREIYEFRRLQMNEVATRAEIHHGCKVLDRDYDRMLKLFVQRYEKELN